MFAADAILEAADAGVKLIVAITEGVPVLDMTRVYPFVKEKGARLIGPNCPGLITPGKSEGRHHSGTHLHAGQHRRRESFRNAHLRSRISAYSRRTRPVDLRRHRRRSDQRHELHRLPRGVRGGSGDEGRGDDGRDRRHGRAGSRGLRQAAHEEAGRRIHRRTDGAAGTPHGTRRRDHLRIVGHGGRKNPGVRPTRAWASQSVRWTSSSCSKRGCERRDEVGGLPRAVAGARSAGLRNARRRACRRCSSVSRPLARSPISSGSSAASRKSAVRTWWRSPIVRSCCTIAPTPRRRCRSRSACAREGVRRSLDEGANSARRSS